MFHDCSLFYLYCFFMCSLFFLYVLKFFFILLIFPDLSLFFLYFFFMVLDLS